MAFGMRLSILGVSTLMRLFEFVLSGMKIINTLLQNSVTIY